ncbi:hypothetical protein RO3G_07609 [Rhizopus delemar RA 99-880]|uniref:Uncharacterized protein n=1 Tax=Rhizopus delemar (strain RA 99-880 / ATCC MYA-4621 / FGSC 9543 / NRRL 43880) TaxID=246409 RepID=I1C374_RHIO9|nr:hypothetical protein RO3G_07609 [Rhizopus delemar RA 99-880]|eukprot:EIE82904.1 hypothetical protein RO3G_07609 [Rhizopus delemar RA 99-880]
MYYEIININARNGLIYLINLLFLSVKRTVRVTLAKITDGWQQLENFINCYNAISIFYIKIMIRVPYKSIVYKYVPQMNPSTK